MTVDSKRRNIMNEDNARRNIMNEDNTMPKIDSSIEVGRKESKLEEIRGNEDRAIDHLQGIDSRLDDILSRSKGNPSAATEAAAQKEAPQGIVFEIIGKQQDVWELINSIEEKFSELEELF